MGTRYNPVLAEFCDCNLPGLNFIFDALIRFEINPMARSGQGVFPYLTFCGLHNAANGPCHLSVLWLHTRSAGAK